MYVYLSVSFGLRSPDWYLVWDFPCLSLHERIDTIYMLHCMLGNTSNVIVIEQCHPKAKHCSWWLHWTWEMQDNQGNAALYDAQHVIPLRSASGWHYYFRVTLDMLPNIQDSIYIVYQSVQSMITIEGPRPSTDLRTSSPKCLYDNHYTKRDIHVNVHV